MKLEVVLTVNTSHETQTKDNETCPRDGKKVGMQK